MSYFPLLNAPYCTGWTTVHNYPPNNWEIYSKVRFLNVTWTDGAIWRSHRLGELQSGQSKKIGNSEIDGIVSKGALPLFSLTDQPISAYSDTLPIAHMPKTLVPNWRATIGLKSQFGTRVSYQGEIDPFPSPSSLVSFNFFQQFGENLENYLLFMNVEFSPFLRTSILEIRDSSDPTYLLSSHEVKNNQVNIIKLSNGKIPGNCLPIILCSEISGVPLFFSSYGKGQFLSLEHTHPPSSLALHGRRLEAQKLLKRLWFSKSVVNE